MGKTDEQSVERQRNPIILPRVGEKIVRNTFERKRYDDEHRAEQGKKSSLKKRKREILREVERENRLREEGQGNENKEKYQMKNQK